MAPKPDPLAQIASGLRDALRKLDDDLVPQTLDRVMAHTGKRLTPPLVRLVIDEVDRNEWLREQLAEHVDAEREPLVAGFVERSAGWWRALLADSDGPPARPSDADTKKLTKLAEERDEAKRRLKELRAQHDATAAELRRMREESRKQQPGAVDDGGAAIRAQLDELRIQLAGLEADRNQLADRVADLMRRRSDDEPDVRAQPDGGGARSFGRVGATELARRLDLEYAALAHIGGHGRDHGAELVEPASGEAAVVQDLPLRLPVGIAPDTAEAIRWMTRTDRALRVIVDGYNVTFLIDPVDFRTGPVRRRLVDSVAPLRRLLPAGSNLEVVFDSAEGADTEPIITASGVTVRFTATGMIADDEIVEAVGAAARPTVVITNDRELRMRAEQAGALALWGDALVRWLEL